LTPDELADESLTSGNGNRFWHKSCRNGDALPIKDVLAKSLRAAKEATP